MNSSSQDRVALAVLSVLLLIGCARQEGEAEAPTPSAHRPTKTLQDPLTEREVRTFLNVMHEIPGEKAPEFEPLAQAMAHEEMSAAQLAEVYRQEYRAMFDAARQGQQWRKDVSLMQTLARHQTQPEDFAALMIRMSWAITAGALSPQVDLARATDKAEAQVAEYIARIDALDRVSKTPTTIEQRRQLIDGLQDLVAFAEFARILKDVPQASCAVVKQFHSQLAEHLPPTGDAGMFERTTESHIVPTSYDEWSSPAPSAHSSQ